MKKNLLSRPFLQLFLAAFLLLFVQLGVDSISNSEGRWFSVAQEMVASGDYLHPTINGEPYFDKPLFSYWFIATASLFTGGVNAWSARLPSAAAAMIALWALVEIAKKLFDEDTALLAGWVLVTTYSFAFWGRLAEADMEQTAFVLAALAVYFRVREKPGVWGYAAFWSLCAAGAQTKGLAAFALPVLGALTDMILTKTFLKHLCVRSFCGLLAGMAVYFVPFALESFTRGSGDAAGLMLVFRENITRAVDPWDHNSDPWWIYFRYLPQLMLPWVIVLVPAVAACVCRMLRKESFSYGEKWLGCTIAVFFLLFSCSRSRRIYYILPLVPFCALFCGAYLAAGKAEWSAGLAGILLKVADWLFPVAGVLALLAPLGLLPAVRLRLFAPFPAPEVYETLVWTLFLAGVVLTLFQFLQRRGRLKVLLPGRFPELARIFPSLWWLLFTVFALLIPPADADPALRSPRPFCETVHRMLIQQQTPPENLGIFGRNYRNLIYYLALPRPAQLFHFQKQTAENRSFTDDSYTCGGPEELKLFLERARRDGGMLLLRRDALQGIRMQDPALWTRITERPVLVVEEPFSLSENLSVHREKGQERTVRRREKFRAKKMAAFIYPRGNAVTKNSR